MKNISPDTEILIVEQNLNFNFKNGNNHNFFAVAVVIFVAFKVFSPKANEGLIKKYEDHIEEQHQYIKQLEKDYNDLVAIQYHQIKERLNGKQI